MLKILFYETKYSINECKHRKISLKIKESAKNHFKSIKNLK